MIQFFTLRNNGYCSLVAVYNDDDDNDDDNDNDDDGNDDDNDNDDDDENYNDDDDVRVALVSWWQREFLTSQSRRAFYQVLGDHGSLDRKLSECG